MQTEHNIKTLKATPGPVKRSTTITRPKGEVQTRASIKCILCSFVCKSVQSMTKHTEMLHNNDTAKELLKEKRGNGIVM